MQLKRYPKDFRVREIVDLPDPMDRGDYFVHFLRKEKLDTLEAISIVAREGNVDRADIAFAGLKDRQGITEQYVTIKGKRVEFRRAGIQIHCVGRVEQPITSKVSRGNEFLITVRGLERRDVDRLQRRIPELVESGFPNYFDDQRFNCLRHGQGFVMKSVLEGRFDKALKQLIATPSRIARGGDVKLKQLLHDHWTDWARCRRIARGPIYGRVFEHLERNPEDFRGALELMPSRSKLIHAFAYQSYLWNRAVSRHVESLLDPRRRTMIETEAGRIMGWWNLPPSLRDRLRDESTPLYGPEGNGGSPAFRKTMQRTLREANLSETAFDIHAISGMALREEPRMQLVMPDGLREPRVERDDANRGLHKAGLKFRLPRGSYATMLLKCLWATPWRRPRDRQRPRTPEQKTQSK